MKQLTRINRYGIALVAGSFLASAVCSSQAAAKPPHDPLRFHLTVLGTFTNGAPFNQAAAKVVTHDPATQRLFVANERDNRVEVLSIAHPSDPVKIGALDMDPYGAIVNGVSACGGILAVVVQAPTKTDPGRAVLFDSDLNLLMEIPVGSLPDFVTFSPNGRYILVANEGEPNTYNNYGSETNGPSIDPEGSITIIDLVARELRTATFTAFNDAVLDPSIRIFGPNATVAQDLEPESIAISADSTTAYVTLQENNAMAIVDIATATVTDLVGLGFKDWSIGDNRLDASDQDGAINIRHWPVKGVYLPDEVATFQFKGHTFLAMANEGDSRDYPGYKEDARVSSLTLDPTVFPDAADLKRATNLGRLSVSKVGGDIDGDGDYDVLYTIGGRSFSIRTANGDLVFDSSDDFEQITAELFPGNFNCSNTKNTKDDRSTSKGPEPEGIVIGKVAGRELAFIGSERIGGIFVYNISDPYAPHFVDYVNNRNFSGSFNYATAGDLGPEGLKFISADNSPNGKPILVVASEVSGTVTLFQINVSGPPPKKIRLAAMD